MQGLTLVPFSFWLGHGSGDPPPALAALQQAMAEQLEALGHPEAEALRWAITGVDPERGLRLEGIGLSRAVGRADSSGAAIAATAEDKTHPAPTAPVRQT